MSSESGIIFGFDLGSNHSDEGYIGTAMLCIESMVYPERKEEVFSGPLEVSMKIMKLADRKYSNFNTFEEVLTEILLSGYRVKFYDDVELDDDFNVYYKFNKSIYVKEGTCFNSLTTRYLDSYDSLGNIQDVKDSELDEFLIWGQSLVESNRIKGDVKFDLISYCEDCIDCLE